MLNYTSSNSEYPTKQSAGFMFIRLLSAQLIFVVMCTILVFASDSTTSYRIPSFEILNISLLDVILILLGIVTNFIYFLLVFASWQYTQYSISPPHLIVRQKLFLKDHTVIDLAAVKDFRVHQGIFGSIFNYGTIYIYFNMRKPSLKLRGVPFPGHYLAQLKIESVYARKKTTLTTDKRYEKSKTKK